MTATVTQDGRHEASGATHEDTKTSTNEASTRGASYGDCVNRDKKGET
jgi:hypothetical protein